MHRIAVCLMSCLLISVGASLAATHHARLALAKEHRALLDDWLRHDCTNDSAAVVATLQEHGRAIEAALWEAYSLGPGPEEEATFTATLGPIFDARRRWLRKYGPDAVGAGAAEQISAQTEDAYRAEELRRFRIRWRDAALAGLGHACTPAALRRLRSVVSDKKSPHVSVARAAIATCRSQAPPPQKER